MSSLEQGLTTIITEEAQLRMVHIRLVEAFSAITGSYVRDNPTAERFADTVLLMERTIGIVQGTDKLADFLDPQLGEQGAILTVGEPLSVSDRLETYKANRRGARQAVADLTQDLRKALEATIAASSPDMPSN